MTDARAVVVTGATGFIGRHLCDRLRREGWEVRALARSTTAYPWTEPGVLRFACDLPGQLDAAAFESARVVVHAAYVTRHKDHEQARQVNEAGTREVISACRRAGVSRLIFLSSQSAHDGALSYYGRSKRDLERLLDPQRDLILRPGLVLGAGDAGLFGRMAGTVARSKLIPLFSGGRQPLQTIHVEDLCEGIATAMRRDLTGVFTLAEPDAISMREFLELLAARLHRRPLFVPVPIGPALGLLRLVEALRLPFPVSSENLLGLRQMRRADTRPDLEKLGIRVRSARQSLEEIFRPTAAGG